MILVADIGNTNVCVALFEKNALLHVWRFASLRQRPADEWQLLLSQALQAIGQSFERLEAFVVCSVVPEISEAFTCVGERNFKDRFLMLGTEASPFPNKALIDHPGEEGADLMVNAYAAHTLYGPGPVFVVDFGTATTVTKVDDQGNFCGVAIAPGMNLSADALFKAAAGLPRLSLKKPTKVVGTNTVDSVRSGLFWGYVSLVEGLLTRAQRESGFQRPVKVIATGGMGHLFAHEIPMIEMYDPDLTLKGLKVIYAYLCEKGLIKFYEEQYKAV